MDGKICGCTCNVVELTCNIPSCSSGNNNFNSVPDCISNGEVAVEVMAERISNNVVMYCYCANIPNVANLVPF